MLQSKVLKIVQCARKQDRKIHTDLNLASDCLREE